MATTVWFNNSKFFRLSKLFCQRSFTTISCSNKPFVTHCSNSNKFIIRKLYEPQQQQQQEQQQQQHHHHGYLYPKAFLSSSSRLQQHRRTLHTSNSYYSAEGYSRPKLSPQEVSTILRQNEDLVKLREEQDNDWEENTAADVPSFQHSIASVDSNQLAANTPIEDKLSVARCLHTTGFLFGVFDGHGGPECSQVVSKRLFDYIAATLLPRPELEKVVSEWHNGQTVKLIHVYNDLSEFVPELSAIYDQSLFRWCKTLLAARFQDFSMEEALTGAFTQLDHDLGRELKENHNSNLLEPLLRVAVSGCVACVAHVDGPHLHVANTGDCGAALGMQADNYEGWIAQRLTTDHNWENLAEVERVLSEHPKSEASHVVQNQRLLGSLMPFRAFGDFKFKWDNKSQKEFIEPYMGAEGLISHCLTPPYLTSLPQVTYHRLRPHDKFLLLGSDGLWEGMSTLDAITLTGEYMCGRQTLQPLRLPRRAVTLGEVSGLLEQRQQGLFLKPVDTNASTHLIRHSLGGTDSGLDHGRLSHSLTLPPEVRRFFRDDISIHVVFFDTNFLRLCPMHS